MKTLLTKSLLVLSISLLFLTQSVLSKGTQRMAVLPGRYILNEHKSAIRIPAFCCDYEKSSPSASINFKALTSSSDNYVLFSGEQIKLNESINKGIISFSGINLQETLNDTNYLSTLSAEEQEQYRLLQILISSRDNFSFSQFKKLLESPMFSNQFSSEDLASFNLLIEKYDSLTVVEKIVFDNYFKSFMEPIFEEYESSGDHTGLKITNHSKYPITVVINKPVILGNQNQSISDLNLIRLYLEKCNANLTSNKEIQSNIWDLKK